MNKDKHQQPEQPERGFGNVPSNVPRQTPEQAVAQQEQPDSPELMAARAVMGTPKLAVIGGHTGIVYLTDYDVSSQSYDGEFHRNRSMNTGDVLPAVTPVHGLRRFTPDSRSEFVFVECNEDTAQIRNLQRKLQARA